MMLPMITCRTLTDGGQEAADVARHLASFLDAARAHDRARRLRPRALGRERGARARRAAAARRSAASPCGSSTTSIIPNPIPVPPPPKCVPEDIAALPVPTRAVSGIPDLMHHKFVVRDGAAVLTGSTNWTDDSWTRQENVMVTVESAELGEAYALAFDELWSPAGASRRDASSRVPSTSAAQSCGRGSAPATATRSRTASRRRSDERGGASASARP